jgi:hypothetical protein
MMRFLSPFLYIGLISENLSQWGNIPVANDPFIMYVKGEIITCLQFFSTLIGISSYSPELVVFNLSIIFPILFVVT